MGRQIQCVGKHRSNVYPWSKDVEPHCQSNRSNEVRIHVPNALVRRVQAGRSGIGLLDLWPLSLAGDPEFIEQEIASPKIAEGKLSKHKRVDSTLRE